jgi:hypothetical protein
MEPKLRRDQDRDGFLPNKRRWGSWWKNPDVGVGVNAGDDQENTHTLKVVWVWVPLFSTHILFLDSRSSLVGAGVNVSKRNEHPHSFTQPSLISNCWMSRKQLQKFRSILRILCAFAGAMITVHHSFVKLFSFPFSNGKIRTHYSSFQFKWHRKDRLLFYMHYLLLTVNSSFFQIVLRWPHACFSFLLSTVFVRSQSGWYRKLR